MAEPAKTNRSSSPESGSPSLGYGVVANTASSPEATAARGSSPFEGSNDSIQAIPQFPASSQLPAPEILPRVSRSPPQNATPTGDPRVAGLRAMFPDYDEAILFSVLESANGNQETAIEILLGMSDPEYKPDPAAGLEPAMTQEDLDEQLARRLMLEEQEQQARLYEQQINRPSPQRRNSRTRPQQGEYLPPPGPPSAQGPGAMSEIQETITKAAEVGKKTLGGLFTKVKAKIQEFEQGRATTSQESQWVGGYDPQQHPSAQTNYAPYHHGSAAAPSLPPASYYDPNVPSPVISEQTLSPPSRTPAPAVEGYDVSPNAPAATPIPQPAAAASLSTSGATSVPPPASSTAPIDGGKLGLLPKRPVSLVRDPPSNRQQPRRSLDSDDGLEYAENPFEDHKK